MNALREQVRRAVASAQLLTRGDRVLVGVSGGPDSMALLHLLASLQADLGVRLSVVHVNHQLRPEAAQDAAFVEAVARQWALPVTVITRAVRDEAARRGLSLEDGARRIRYDAFFEAARREAANRLALAHTADDQAETVLMRLMRGAGLTGLGGIPMTRVVEEVTVVRPLLSVWRDEILAYLAAQRIAYREDATNADPRFLRNRIRHELLPLLEQSYNPQIKPLLHQLAEQCRTDAAFLHAAAARQWKRLVKAQAGQWVIRLEAFLKQPAALQRQLIRLVVQRLHGDLTGFEFRHWMEMERLLTDRPSGTILDLPGRLQFERTDGQVVARRLAASSLVGSR